MAALPFQGSNLWRVTSPSLDPRKNWYILTKENCGARPTDFAKRDIFSRFPDEIRSVSARELLPAKSSYTAKFNRMPSTLYVASTFGLCAGLLRRKEIPSGGLLCSPVFEPVVTKLNSVALDVEAEDKCKVDLGSGGNFCPSQCSALNIELENRKAKIESLELQLKSLQAKISDLESDMEISFDSTSCSEQESSCSSSPSTSPSSSCSSIDETKNSPTIGKTTKKKRVQRKCRQVMASLSDVAEKYKESIGCVLGNSFIFGDQHDQDQVRDTLSEIVDIVMETKGKRGFSDLFSSPTHARILQSMRVPEWVLLYFKLHAKLPDQAWQTLLNLSQLGKSGRSGDTPLLLTKNDITALKKLIFSIVRKTLRIQKINDANFEAWDVNLSSVLVWAIREQRLYSQDTDNMEFNIKLDGRPLGGKDQVAVGLAPIGFANKSSESALSILPIAIGNCKEERSNLKQLLSNLNCQKNVIKKHGIVVDGKKYNITFTVTVDYKALCLLLSKEDDEDFRLGGKGYEVECCAFCDAIRACTTHGAGPDETCLDCLRSKANIGRCSGIRDDLNFLLEEDLTSINLCSLHCEMRNCEQLLGSLGLFAYRVGTLDKLNEALSEYGPENCRGFPRVTIKERKGQQTEIDRKNIKVASFSGSTERQILKNFEDIVKRSLPIEKVTQYYEECTGAGKEVILNFVTYLEERKLAVNEMLEGGTFIRDYGTRQETVDLEDARELKSFLENLRDYWVNKQKEVEDRFLKLDDSPPVAQEPKAKKRKRGKKDIKHSVSDPFAKYAAELQLEFFTKVCCDWREIALTLRDKVFEDCEEQLIDIHDVKCKEWGFLLKKLFGLHLGTGDYGHLVVDHSAMLLRQFRSFYKYSGQGFESSHKLHRQLYSRATNHDSSGPGQSLNQILTHWYTTVLLSLRYQFHEARACIVSGKNKFTLRGFDWKGVDVRSWTKEKKAWILVVADLFEQMFGGDFLKYYYDNKHGTKVDDSVTSTLLEYSHEYWESQYGKGKEGHVAMENFCSPEVSFISDIMESARLQPDPVASQPTGPLKQPVPAPKPVPKDQPLSTQKPAPKVKPAPTQPVPKQHPPPKCPKRCYSESKPDTTLSASSQKVHVIEDDSDWVLESQQTALQAAMMKARTRGEMAALHSKIPPLSRSSSTLKAVYGKPSNSDPFSLAERPCEGDIQRALELLAGERKAGKEPTGIEISGMGGFSERALLILKRFCMIREVYRKVSSEDIWLSQMKFSPGDRIKVETALWHNSATIPILRSGNKGIDPSSFSDLVEERYIDSFVLDTCISKFLDVSAVNETNATVYFPTDFYEWMSSNDKNFQQLQLSARVECQLADVNDLQQILVPVYMPNHWGLIFIDLVNQELYFDDGLTSAVPSTALPSVKHCLDLLLEMYTYQPALQTRFWQSCSLFKRFGMPSQAPVDSKMIGVGSCGIGVIMAARDFIENGPLAVNNFQWRYSDMDLHRKQLMLQILKWSN